MDRLRALKYFIAVADSGSFTDSAAQFNVPASSVSRRISDLEQALGATLLMRSTRVVRLSEIGQTYLKQVKPLVHQLEQADESVRSYQREPMGKLRISSMVGFGESRLIPLLDEFAQRFPKITLDVSLSDEVTALERDDIDIAIRGGYAPNERVVAIKLLDNQFHPFVAPVYLARFNTPTSPHQLNEHRGLFFKTPNGPTPWLSYIDGQWQDVSPKQALVSNNGNWLIKKAVEGEGLILLPTWSVQTQLDSGELVPLALTPPVVLSQQGDAGVYLLYQKQRYLVPKIKVAVDFLVSRLKLS